MLLRGQRPEHLLDNVHLVDLALPWEQRLSVDELAEDAPDGPDVHRLGVRRRTEQQLGGAVPGGEGEGERSRERSGEGEEEKKSTLRVR